MIVDHKALFETMPIPRFWYVRMKGRLFCSRNQPSWIGIFQSQRRPDCRIPYRTIDGQRKCPSFWTKLLKFVSGRKSSGPHSCLAKFSGWIACLWFWINPLFDFSGKVVLLDVMAQPDCLTILCLQRNVMTPFLCWHQSLMHRMLGLLLTDRNRRIVRVNDSFVRVYGWLRSRLSEKTLRYF